MSDDARETPPPSFEGSREEQLQLARLSAAIAGSDESVLREVMQFAAPRVSHSRAEEVILQSYLFAGFPRTLNASRLWRALFPDPPADTVAPNGDLASWRADGERTCATVYGDMYDRLRENVSSLHPRLDEWMIVDGYGKVLSRPGLDLATRELCVIAACAAAGQQRQLHSHLHGALNSGAHPSSLEATLDALADLVPASQLAGYKLLLKRVLETRNVH